VCESGKGESSPDAAPPSNCCQFNGNRHRPASCRRLGFLVAPQLIADRRTTPMAITCFFNTPPQATFFYHVSMAAGWSSNSKALA
jgi:hypothetical protein